jgi:hypothetical protein
VAKSKASTPLVNERRQDQRGHKNDHDDNDEPLMKLSVDPLAPSVGLKPLLKSVSNQQPLGTRAKKLESRAGIRTVVERKMEEL